MTCSNPQCANPRKDHLSLFPGKLCAECRHLYVEPAAPEKKMGRPVGAVPYNKAAYNKQYAKDNPRTEYHRDRKRAANGVEKGQFVAECDGLYKVRRGMFRDVRLTWSERSHAKIYQSRKLAEYAVRKIGKGNVEKVI